MNLIGYSVNFIDVKILLPDTSQWRLTGYYGFPERQRRQHSWNLLRDLSTKSTIPWCCVGDFNDLLAQSEKRGRLPHPVRLINDFWGTVEDCDFTDIGMTGHQYTWEKGRGPLILLKKGLIGF